MNINQQYSYHNYGNLTLRKWLVSRRVFWSLNSLVSPYKKSLVQIDDPWHFFLLFCLLWIVGSVWSTSIYSLHEMKDFYIPFWMYVCSKFRVDKKIYDKSRERNIQKLCIFPCSKSKLGFLGVVVLLLSHCCKRGKTKLRQLC